MCACWVLKGWCGGMFPGGPLVVPLGIGGGRSWSGGGQPATPLQCFCNARVILTGRRHQAVRPLRYESNEISIENRLNPKTTLPSIIIPATLFDCQIQFWRDSGARDVRWSTLPRVSAVKNRPPGATLLRKKRFMARPFTAQDFMPRMISLC